jgi:hypothetical protein
VKKVPRGAGLRTTSNRRTTMSAIQAEELAKKATLLKWAVHGVIETARESAIEAEQLGALDDLAGEVESGLRALAGQGEA